MTYLGELRQHWRPLAAASLGCGTSLPLFAYTNTVFSPFLIKEFGWSRSQFALVGLTMLATLAVLPVVGRLADRFGVKCVAAFGAITMPLCFLGYSTMQGNFYFFLLMSTLVLMIGSTTGPLTYSRLIAESFDKAQGLALTIMNCLPAALAIILLPALNWTIEHYGWRTAYLCVGAFVLVFGIAALLLIPPHRAGEGDHGNTVIDRPKLAARQDYPLILKSRVFWIICAGMFLCLLQTPLHSAQMNIMLMDNGLTAALATQVVSFYAAGTIAGRIGCGLALDKFNTPIVTALSMGLPAIGYLILGSSLDSINVITLAMFMVGLAVGAESDLISYLVARYFKIRIYATTLSLVHVCSFAASAMGALAISLTLKLFDNFAPYLFFVAGAITVGSLLFLLLPKSRDAEKIG